MLLLLGNRLGYHVGCLLVDLGVGNFTLSLLKHRREYSGFPEVLLKQSYALVLDNAELFYMVADWLLEILRWSILHLL